MFTDPYLGTVTLFAGNFAPNNWAFCNGQTLNISAYTALYSIIGTAFGGDGISTFALPNLCGRVAVHAGQAPNMQAYILGETGGNEAVAISVNNLPVHTHTLLDTTVTGPPCSSKPGETDMPGGNYPAQLNASTAAYSTASAAIIGKTNLTLPSPPCQGGTQPIPVMSPFLAMNYIICIEGAYPSHS